MQWWIDLLSPFAAGLLVAGVAAWLAQFGLERRKPPRGWRKVGPGPMLTAAVLGCAALAGLMAYVRLFVGSARADAEQQMLILTFLVAAFAAGAIYSCVIVRKVLKRDLRWQSGRLNYADASGQRVTRQFTEVAGIDPRPFATSIAGSGSPTARGWMSRVLRGMRATCWRPSRCRSKSAAAAGSLDSKRAYAAASAFASERMRLTMATRPLLRWVVRCSRRWSSSKISTASMPAASLAGRLE